MTEETSQTAASSGADRRLHTAAALRRNGECEAAVDEARRAIEIASRAGDDRSLAMAENMIAEVEWDRGRWDLASRLLGAAREHAQAAGDEALLLLVESNEAAVWTDLGQGELARDSLGAALGRLGGVDDHPGAPRILRNLGRVLAADEQWTAADGLLARAMACAKRSSDYREGALLAIERTRLALRHGDALRADAHLGTVAMLVERVEDEAVRADAACLEGEAHRIQGRPEAAERSLLQTIELARAANAAGIVAYAWRTLAEVLVEQARQGEAIAALEAARLQFVALGARGRAAEAGRRSADLRARSDPPR